MSIVSWLHLSDLHFCTDTHHAWDEDIVLRALLKDIAETTTREGLLPLAFIMVSGDIAFSGQAAEYDAAGRFFDRLLEVARLDKSRLFLVPGNHDVDRKAIKGGDKTITNSFNSRQALAEVLEDPDSRRLVSRRFHAYESFLDRYFEGERSSWGENQFFVERLPMGGDHGILALLGFNSAWAAGSDDDLGKLVLGERRVRDAIGQSEDATLRITCLHHPLDWLREFDRSDCEPLLTQDCGFLLHGHLHRTGLTALETPDGAARIIAAGACYETREFPNRYNLVGLDLDAGRGKIYLRKYSDAQGGFWTKDVETYRNVPDGVYEFGLRRETGPDGRNRLQTFSLRGSEDRSTSPGNGREMPPEERREAASAPPTPKDLEIWRKAYLGRVYQTTRRLSLAGIDPKAASECRRAIDLSAVYTALLTLNREVKVEMKKEQRAAEVGSFLSVLEELNRHRRLVLLGDPGSGKSTFVNFTALCMAGEYLGEAADLSLLTGPLPDEEGEDQEKQQTWRHGFRIPIRLVLRDFAARGLPPRGEKAVGRHIWDFLSREWADIPGMGDYFPCLQREVMGKGLLLLDGLDEVPEMEDGRREQIKQAVEDFAATCRDCRMLVTSRTYAYRNQDWKLAGFFEAQLAPFGRGQIFRFVDRWYRHVADLKGDQQGEAKGKAALLRQAIGNNERLQALAGNPLLLTLMASLHAWRGGSLPEKREELYADTVDLLLDIWQRGKEVYDREGKLLSSPPSLIEWLGADRDRMRGLLNRLAFEAHRAHTASTGTADIEEKDLLAGVLSIGKNPDLRPHRLIEHLSQGAGLLIPHGRGVYTFPHRTLQEYLAACHLTDHGFPDELTRLVLRDPNRWREVTLLAGAKAGRGSKFALWALIESLCPAEGSQDFETLEYDRTTVVAGQLIAESADGKNLGGTEKTRLERVRQRLTRILAGDRLPAVERAEAGRILARIGDPRSEAIDVDRMQFCLVPAGPFWMGEGKDMRLNRSLDYDYRIGRYPVTNAQYAAFVNAGDYTNPTYWTEAWDAGIWQNGRIKDYFGDSGRDKAYDYGDPWNLPNHPVVGVSWYEATAFGRWLNERWIQESKLDKTQEVRLSTEAEWEKAARGGEEIPAERQIVLAWEKRESGRKKNPLPKAIYPWGDGKPDPEFANYRKTGIGTSNAVGCFPRGESPCGAMEMSGNVWEWCRDWYDEKKKYRVLRGGGWLYGADSLVSSSRGRGYPDGGGRSGGFRLVVSVARTLP